MVEIRRAEMRLEVSSDPPPPEPTPPPGGWRKPSCSFSDHRWELDVDEGRANIRCADPCDKALFHPSGVMPVCLVDWDPYDFTTPEPIAVGLTYVDDSSPAGPWGAGDYGYYIEVSAIPASTPKEDPEGGLSARGRA